MLSTLPDTFAPVCLRLLHTVHSKPFIACIHILRSMRCYSMLEVLQLHQMEPRKHVCCYPAMLTYHRRIFNTQDPGGRAAGHMPLDEGMFVAWHGPN